ncbi:MULTISPECIES: hypothetical protein [unclassified Moorena]|uniref:hypothetical protein n=1 Tax=unclassified Moorena TaxID=2683338 RepID=UPI0013FF1BE6|nr:MULTISPECIES: hypothetical protein [unclassified Moorena]NEO12052.1 hypothetical protein [Moorena sp. SIO3E8]NEQ03488.1 hypothetical protein [Moorena sp. SIO3F7]
MRNPKKQLTLLSWTHYMFGGFFGFYSLFILMLYIPFGLFMIGATDSIPADLSGELSEWFKLSRNVSSDLPGYLLVISGAILFILGEVFAFAIILSGYMLRKSKNYWFSFMIACLLCWFRPFGTLVGVLTIVVLSRQSVKKLYPFNY